MSDTLEIAGRRIGDGAPCFIIAEAGVNHNGQEDMARRMVDISKEACADAIKFQTFKASRLVVADTSAGRPGSQFDMLRGLELSDESHRNLWSYCQSRRLLFLSAPFDEKSADLLGELGVHAYKIASGELTNLPFLSHVAKKGRPVILSTGMATLDEVGVAVETIRSSGNDRLALLHCVSSYPTRPEDANLRAMETLKKTFQVPVGFSDHTHGIEISLAAVALGADIIEKHFTLGAGLPGPDQSFSIEPDDLTNLVRCIRNVESALGHGRKEPAPSEIQTARAARKSLVAARLLRAGTTLTEDCIVMKRPGTGIPPPMLKSVVGRSVKRDIAEDTILTMDMLS